MDPGRSLIHHPSQCHLPLLFSSCRARCAPIPPVLPTPAMTNLHFSHSPSSAGSIPRVRVLLPLLSSTGCSCSYPITKAAITLLCMLSNCKRQSFSAAVSSALLSQLLEFQKLQGRSGQTLQLLLALLSARTCWSAQKAVWDRFICLGLFTAHFICLDAWQMSRQHGPTASASNFHEICSRDWVMNCSHIASSHPGP